MGLVSQLMDETPREDFLPASARHYGATNRPIPIGHGQTNSQPYTVRLMLGWLDVQPGDKVLDVGSGSGWTTALLSRLSGSKGSVTAVELVPELLRFGQNNCQRAGVDNAKFHQALADVFGWPEGAPYNRILVSAMANELPQELTEQLALGGRLVIPVDGDVLVIDKDQTGNLHTRTNRGFMFVPLVKPGSGQA